MFKIIIWNQHVLCVHLYNGTQKAQIVGRKLNNDQQSFCYSAYSQKKMIEDVEKGDH